MRTDVKRFTRFIGIIFLAVLAIFFVFQATPEKSNKYTDFTFEVIENIDQNYWEDFSEEQIINFYGQAIAYLTQTEDPELNDRDGLESKLNDLLKEKTDEEKAGFIISLSDTVLTNLQPAGVNRLHSERIEQEFRQETLKNVDKTTDLYEEIGVEEDATQEEILLAIAEQTKTLEEIINNENSTEEEILASEEKLKKVERANETIVDEQSREIYNEDQIETTVFGEFVEPDMLVVKIKRMSPTTAQEFVDTINGFSDKNITSLILDMRGNIGGLEGVVKLLLGFFIDSDKDVYEILHQGETTGFKPDDRGIKFSGGNIVVLQDIQTQSVSELMISGLRKNNIGISVGTRTGGSGAIKNTYPMENSLQFGEDLYNQIFLINALVVRHDGQFIQGQGVEPIIDITKETWKEDLSKLVENKNLVDTIISQF